jgi:hypothetical protein
MAPINFEQSTPRGRGNILGASKTEWGIVTNAPTRQVKWSIGRNVRFLPGAVAKNLGKSLLVTVSGSLPIRAMFTFKGHDGIFRTIVCCDTKIYSYTNDFGTVQDITPSPAPSSGATDVWTFTIIGRMPIISNGLLNQRWMWPGFSSALTDLTNAPPIIKAMIGDQGRLLAGNIRDDVSYDYPGRLRWSEDYLPTSWPIDQTQKGDREDLLTPHGGLDAQEKIQNFGYLEDRIGIWTERNIWYSDPIDSPLQHTIKIWHPDVGLISPRLIVTVLGHNYFMDWKDIYDLGPEGLVPLGFDLRNFIFPNLNKSALASNFAFYKPWTREVFFCVATGSNATPDTAIVFNTELKNLSICDVDYLCNNYSWLQNAITWDTIPFGTWDTITDSSWDQMDSTGIIPYSVVGNASGQILKMDSTFNNNGVAIEAYIETGDFGEADSRLSMYRFVPHFKPVATKQPVMIQVGHRESLHEEIRWSLPYPVTIGVDLAAYFKETGRYCRFRIFTDQQDSPWILEGYQAEMNQIRG